MKIREWLNKSPVNFHSELCIYIIGGIWIIEIILMTIAAYYNMIVNCDGYVWSEVQLLATAPITAGIFTFGLQNAGTHVMKAYKGEDVPKDFPEDDPEGDDDENPIEEDETNE